MTQGSLLDLAAELEQLADKEVRDHSTLGPWPHCPESHCRPAWVLMGGEALHPRPALFSSPAPLSDGCGGAGTPCWGAPLTAAPTGHGCEGAPED